jgi:hypothetical protein
VVTHAAISIIFLNLGCSSDCMGFDKGILSVTVVEMEGKQR